mmetsp:Transcript_7309/g.9886  ORF Transcript_7309/g.9886 Transcript_7309/m.9886 type:complete len:224 (-) Transcript_7309:826-1497(-)
MSLHEHLLLLELLSNILGTGTGYLYPGFGEKSTGCQHEGKVEHSMEWVSRDVRERSRWGEVVHQSTNRDQLTGGGVLCFRPATKKLHKDVVAVTFEKQLRNEVEIGHQGRLQDDGHIRSVKQLDRVRSLLTTCALRSHGQVHAESLEIYHDQENQHSGKKVGHVRQILTIKGLFKGPNFVGTRDEKVEQSDHGSFEFCSSASIDGGGTERFPDNVFTDIRGNK